MKLSIVRKMFKLTLKQQECYRRIVSHARSQHHFLLLYGGTRSAKTAFACYYLITCAIKYPKCTSIICRDTLTNLKASIILNTFPTMLELRYGISRDNQDFCRYHNSSPMYVEFFNGSIIYFVGVQDNSGFDKILGRECSAFLMDEVSQIPYKAFAKLSTRMGEVNDCRKVGLLTMNPTSQLHWPYKLFLQKTIPTDENLPLPNPEMYDSIKMNPIDNLDNLPPDYLTVLENLSPDDKERFLYGNFLTSVEDAVYGPELAAAKKDNRITLLPRQLISPHYPLEIAYDIGWDDFTSAWLYQVLPDRINFIAYIEHNHISIIDFTKKIKELIYTMSRDWPDDVRVILPHDAAAHYVGTGMTVKHILTMHASYTPAEPISYSIPTFRPSLYEGINACRVMFSRCYIDEDNCKLGLQRLGNYTEYDTNLDGSYKRALRHDDNSHCADAYRYAICSFYFQPPYQEPFRRYPDAIYGSDLLNAQTRRKMGFNY